MLKKSSFEFVKFCTVGLITTSISYFIFFIALNYLNINYLIASALGFISGLTIGYPINKYWTFSKKNCPNNHVLPYFIVYFSSLLLSLIFLKIVVEYIGIIPEIANILSIGLTTCTNFLGTKFWVFHDRKK